MLVEDVIKLRTTLNLLEVRGDNVKVLANCMYFVDQMITDIQNGKYEKEESNEKTEKKA